MTSSQFYAPVIGAMLALGACSGPSDNHPGEKKETFPVVLPLVKDTFLVNDYVADIEAENNVEVRLRISGFLDRIYVKEGQEVEKGQPLFYINDAEYKTQLASMKAQLASARADVDMAEVEAARVKSLVGKNILSRSEEDVANSKLVAAKAKAEEAAAKVSFAEIQLSYTQVRAPFHGVIDRIPLKTGSLVGEGVLLTTLSDISDVYAYFHVSENEYLYIFKKQWIKDAEVKLVLADGSVYPHTGKVEAAESEIDESTGSIAFKAFFPNPEKLLKHGATGKLKISVPMQNAMLIPQKCIFEQQDKNYVYVPDQNDVLHLKSIETGRRIGNYVIVKSGLDPKDRVVFEGLQLVREGQAIVPEMLPADSAAKR